MPVPASPHGSDPDSTRHARSESHFGIQDSHMTSREDDHGAGAVTDKKTPEEHGSGSGPSASSPRPCLPRLNSKSRAPPSSFGAREIPAQTPEDKQSGNVPGQEASPERPSPAQSPISPDPGSPFHIRQTREVPTPMRGDRRSSTSSSRPRSDSDAHSHTDSHESTPTPRGSPSLRAKSESDGQNPTIQIPKVTPLSSGLTLPPNLAELAEGLEDKFVDEFGNVLDWDGQVLGRVEGDLPSMIGRPVSATGEIMNEAGEVVGYVVENETIEPPPPPPQPIHGMGDGLKVDHMGNILDAANNVVGHFNSEMLGKDVEVGGGGGRSRGRSNGPHRGPHNCSCGDRAPPQPKPTAAPSPSEIYLDVKSTNDGVQLIIKIPTVFNGGNGQNIHISTG